MQVSNDVRVNLGEKNEVVPWDDNNESNEFVEVLEDDVFNTLLNYRIF